MPSAELAERAATLRDLHVPGDPLVVVNVWDVASAWTVAAVEGCRAIATASYAIAQAHGVPDGEHIGRDRMLHVAGRIAANVELPVTADLEAGYGATPAEVGETMRLAIEAGIVGCNLEDARRPVGEAAERVAAARAAAQAEGVPFVINARTDVDVRTPEGVDDALHRGRAYLEAGADCIFVLRAGEAGAIERLAAEMGGPVSVGTRNGGLAVSELADLGVARVSFGPGPYFAALASLERAAVELLGGAAPNADFGFRPQGLL